LEERKSFFKENEMIARLRGRVVEALPNRLVVEAGGGVGYQVMVPLSTYDRLGPREGEEITLLTYLHVRENLLCLYGFGTAEERDIFLLLINRVSGIGPAIGMAILSGMPVEKFKSSVVAGDTVGLSKIKGLGKKTAERIVLELKDKVGVGETWEAGGDAAGSASRDAELGLLALGYKQADARKALQKVLAESPEAGADELIRLALRSMS
jgi:Holliday junction DNA helicase RuvA